MSGTEIFLTVLSAIASVCAILFGYAAFSRNRKKDETAEGRHDGTVMTELGYIKANTDDIKRRQEKQDEQHIEVVERLASVEQSTKQAHKRIDRLEQKGTSE